MAYEGQYGDESIPPRNCSEPDGTDIMLLRLIKDTDRFIVVTFLSCFLGIPICIVGIVANVINITVFLRQGFADSINISLLCLSFADVGSLITLLWRNLLYVPQIGTSDLPLDAISFIYLTGGTPHVTLVRISACITAFIALERCFCIAFPLKVKRIFTQNKTVFINVVIYGVNISAVVPIFFGTQIVWKFYQDRNRTLLGMVFTDNYQRIERVSFILNGLIIPFSAFFIDVVCTVIMVVKLQRQAKWRQEAASSYEATKVISQKDFRIMKMVMTLTIIFIICCVPINVNYVWMLFDKNVNVKGKYANTMLVSASFAFVCEAVNSCLNHFVYIKMSSKFRKTYVEMCSLCKRLAPS